MSFWVLAFSSESLGQDGAMLYLEATGWLMQCAFNPRGIHERETELVSVRHVAAFIPLNQSHEKP